ncbi:MAG: phosphoribosylanthranilate isomerase [Candidatus Omnitrophota bacterium]
MVKVKICGITNLDDALVSIDAGCDALGFVFYKKSQRYIEPESAALILKELPVSITKIGVFANASEKHTKGIARLCGLNMLQFHGNESPGFCAKFKGYKVIKSFRVKDKIDLQDILRYKTFAYLFDTFSESRIGGTGRSFNWRLLQDSGKINKPIFLSGGLTAENVRRAIKAVGPQWVDVSSSLEARPGKKDAQKVKAFIKKTKGKR